MKIDHIINVFVFLTVTTMAMAVCAEDNPGYRIHGDLSLDGSAPQPFEVSVPSNSTARVEIATDIFLEISTPVNVVAETTSVEVVRSIAGERKVLKLINSSGYLERSWSLAICGEEITTSSPAGSVSCFVEPSNGHVGKT